MALRDWSTDEAYSERPSGEGKLLLPASSPHSLYAVMASLRASESAWTVRSFQWLKLCRAESIALTATDEEGEDGMAEDDADILPAESASSAATYWDRLLRHHWQALEKEEGGPHRGGKASHLPGSLALILRKAAPGDTLSLMRCCRRSLLEDALELLAAACAGRLADSLLLCAEASAQSYGEEGEEGLENGAGGAPLSERGSDELPAGRVQRMPSRRSLELGKRERRKRRMDDADEDDLNSLDEPLEGKKKRRAGELLPVTSVTQPLEDTRACLGACSLGSQPGQLAIVLLWWKSSMQQLHSLSPGLPAGGGELAAQAEPLRCRA